MALFSELGGDPDDDADEEPDEDDLLGGADDGLMGDDLFGGEDDGTSSDEDELNYQLDEIEKEVDSLSGRIETVRGENEQISDDIQTVERNVDKLVDLYEIVTHGVNPFVGDQEIGDAFETATGQAGLIGNDPGDAIDEEIASAEAEDFLDDDDMPFDDDDTDDFGTDLDDADEPLEDDDLADDDPLADEEFTDDVLDEDDDLADDPLDEDDDPLETDAAGPDDEDDDLTRFLPDDADRTDDADNADGDDPLEADDDPIDDSADESFDEPASGGVDDGDPPSPDPTGGVSTGDGIDSSPYLETHPSGYAAEITTLEWLEFLVETAGVEGAAQTVAYYRSVGWISEAVETYLHRLLAGFGEERTLPPEDPEPRSILRTDDHKRSLQFIAQIATPERRSGLVEATGRESVEDAPVEAGQPSEDDLDADPFADSDAPLESPDADDSDEWSGSELDESPATEETESVSIDEMKPDPLADHDSDPSADGDGTPEHGAGGTDPFGDEPDGSGI